MSLLHHPDHDPGTCEICLNIKVWSADYRFGLSVAAQNAMHNRISGLMEKAWERGKAEPR